MNRVIREARPSDMGDIMSVMDAAKSIMRHSGNMHQWTDGYPSEAVIAADMAKNGGFVVEDRQARFLLLRDYLFGFRR